MNKKLNIGDYVRTKRGQIGKLKKIEDINCEIEFNGIWRDLILKENIIKSSPNIIDLIEVGDILYLEESDDIACMFFRDIYLVKNEDNLLHIIDDIKNKKCKIISIVTKEQFESMEYKVGDKE